jgi:predicted enzyme related to lactoylglutathione lyase
MKSALTWFEIPVRDMDRAVACYERLLGRPMKREVIDGNPYAVFPYEAPGTGGGLVQDAKRAPGGGTLVYLDVDGELDLVLSRAAAAGAKVVIPRTPIGPNGFIAVLVDTEGNSVGINSRT